MHSRTAAGLKGDILIVDDTPDNLRLLSTILLQQGYQVRRAISGQLAIATVEAEPPDLILLDINLPQMNGYEVCQRLKADQKSQKIPVIFVSILNEALDKVKAFNVGGADYVTKPFQAEEVLARIQHQLELQQLQQQLHDLNAELEAQVQKRTTELHLAFNFEAALKRITDKVRDSLDEQQILETAVRELVLATHLDCCTASLYNLEQRISIICHEYTLGNTWFQKRIIDIELFSEEYHQLLQGQYFQFCLVQPLPHIGHVAVLSCPILDDQGALGDLWLFCRQPSHTFVEQDIHLVQQVANQCAIALRQSRLYQAAQSQVRELERLNYLKDDFLSTVSHELRTPIANIKVAVQLLEVKLQQAGLLNTDALGINRYLKILQDECSREMRLVNNLLDLSRLEAQAEPLDLTSIHLQDWVVQGVEPFRERLQQQQQTLQIDVAPALPPVVSDQTILNRMLNELLDNACKYTPPGETIQIAIQLREDVIQIQVCNSGVEIPEAEQPYIFDKFYRIPNADPYRYGGTGLGLALVKKLLQQIQGTIAVKSEQGKTLFIVEIPRM